MLRITVELIPHGREDQAKVLDVMQIVNVTKDYNLENEYGRVADYSVQGHKRKAGFWELTRAALTVHADRPTREEALSGGRYIFGQWKYDVVGFIHEEDSIIARPSLCLLLHREAIKGVLAAYDLGEMWVVGAALSGTDQPGDILTLAVTGGVDKQPRFDAATRAILEITGVKVEIATAFDLSARDESLFVRIQAL